LLAGTGIVTAAWGLPVPAASVWRTFGRSLELIRIGLVGILVVTVAFMVAVALTDLDPAWLRIALTGPFTLFGIATAVGAWRTSRRSIRLARWSFVFAALVLLAVVALEVLLGAVLPLGMRELPAHEVQLAELAGLGGSVLALALVVLGCAGVDPALRRPSLTSAVALLLAAGAGVAAILLRHHPVLEAFPPAVIVGSVSCLLVAAIVMALHLLGRSVNVSEARAYGERVRAAQRAAKEARLVHERWRAARARSR
jgi:hypothetical protein